MYRDGSVTAERVRRNNLFMYQPSGSTAFYAWSGGPYAIEYESVDETGAVIRQTGQVIPLWDAGAGRPRIKLTAQAFADAVTSWLAATAVPRS